MNEQTKCMRCEKSITEQEFELYEGLCQHCWNFQVSLEERWQDMVKKGWVEEVKDEFASDNTHC